MHQFIKLINELADGPVVLRCSRLHYYNHSSSRRAAMAECPRV